MNRVYFSEQGKPVARQIGNTLFKRVRGGVHQLRQPPAWAIDEKILQESINNGVKMVEIFDVETGKIYKVSINYFTKFGIRLNRGFGLQVALPLNYWIVEFHGVQQLKMELV